MRPRHKAAENDQLWKVLSDSERASMRPRHKAAENPWGIGINEWIGIASMRPRHKAAENLRTVRMMVSSLQGFNEAAA